MSAALGGPAGVGASAPASGTDPTRLGVMPAVYSCLFPEVATIVDELAGLPADLLRVGADAASLADWSRRHVSPSLEIPELTGGRLDLDGLHGAVAARTIACLAPVAPGLAGFGHRYPTAGSSEGLFHLLARAALDGTRRIRVLDGEYEGYAIQAANLGLQVEAVAPEAARSLAPRADALWFISEPSARDGNRLPGGFLQDLLAAGHRLVVDLAYAGGAASLAARPIDVSHSGIVAVVASASKPYGLFRWRIGWAFAREPVSSLLGNRWFHDPGRHLLGLAVLERVGPLALPAAHAGLQRQLVTFLAAASGLDFRPSDALLLATASLPAGQHDPGPWASFVRAGRVRACLTPAFETHFRRLRTPPRPSDLDPAWPWPASSTPPQEAPRA